MYRLQVFEHGKKINVVVWGWCASASVASKMRMIVSINCREINMHVYINCLLVGTPGPNSFQIPSDAHASAANL